MTNDGLFVLFVVKVKKKVQKVLRNAFICNECVELAQELLESSKKSWQTCRKYKTTRIAWHFKSLCNTRADRAKRGAGCCCIQSL